MMMLDLVADIVPVDPMDNVHATTVNKDLSFATDQTPHTNKTGSSGGDELEENLDLASFVAPEDKIQTTQRKVLKTSVQNVAKRIKNIRKKK